MITAYLAGAVFETEYRATCKREFSDLGIKLIDPLEQIEATCDNYKEVVEKDKEAIENCDVVIAFVNQFTCGTVMEILHAWNHKVPVYTINPDADLIYTESNPSQIWLKYHTTKFFTSISDCFAYIAKDIKE